MLWTPLHGCSCNGLLHLNLYDLQRTFPWRWSSLRLMGLAAEPPLGRSNSTLWRSLSPSPGILSTSKRRFPVSVVGKGDESCFTWLPDEKVGAENNIASFLVRRLGSTGADISSGALRYCRTRGLLRRAMKHHATTQLSTDTIMPLAPAAPATAATFARVAGDAIAEAVTVGSPCLAPSSPNVLLVMGSGWALVGVAVRVEMTTEDSEVCSLLPSSGMSILSRG